MSGQFITPDAEQHNELTWHTVEDQLEMHAVDGSDLRQHTSCGFVRDSGHALLHPIGP